MILDTSDRELNTPLAKDSLFHKINCFLTSPIYIAVVVLSAFLSNAFSLELPVYTLYALAVAYICVKGHDLLPLIPIVVCCYIAPSLCNNPGRNEQSVFAGGQGIYLVCLAALIGVSVIWRIVHNRKMFFRKKYRLLPGMLLLSAAYLLGGIGSKDYAQNAPQSIFFALLQALALILPYLLIAGNVDWDTARQDYLAWTGFGVGCLLVLQVGWIYCTSDVIINGVIERANIYTGWGMYNNIGALLAMMIPFPFYLATKYHKGWIGSVIGSFFLVGVLMTCSRASILCGGAIYFACVILMLYYANNRRSNTMAVMIFGGIVTLVFLVFNRPLVHLFSSLLDRGLDPSSRDIIYANGLKIFHKYPIFGDSFFTQEYSVWEWSTSESFTSFFPPRWHNTFVQLLTSCGVVGLVAYLVHRAQTVVLLLSRPSKEKVFIIMSLIALLSTSLFDCHFFNIGPVLFYSMALAFAENCKNK